MPGIPEVKKKKFWETNAFLEALGVIGVLITGTSSVALSIRTIFYPTGTTTREDMTLGWFSIAGVVVMLLAAAIKVKHGVDKDRKEKDEARLDGLHAVLHVIHSLVRHKAKFPRNETNRLRVTIHRVINPKGDGDSGKIEQMFDYVGGDGGGAGRKFSSRPGVIGRAIREREVFAVTRKSTDHASFIKEMVKEWGYTEEEAKQLSFDRNSWMAVPILYKGKDVTGVVYLDSSDEGIFKEEVRDAVTDACRGLAVFISERY